MSLGPVPCTCDQREHACSPPCRAHPERGGGLGNPGVSLTVDRYGPVLADPPLDFDIDTDPFLEPLRAADDMGRVIAGTSGRCVRCGDSIPKGVSMYALGSEWWCVGCIEGDDSVDCGTGGT